MAHRHRHNRRRVRPRNRNVTMNYQTFTALQPPSPHSHTSSTSSISVASWQTTPLHMTMTSLPSGSISYNPQPPTYLSRSPGPAGRPYNIEAERIKMFGGEPGDDIGLCYKMMELFEGMNWIDTLE
ncbi:hypothetical protein PV10_03630 [Exophiala mesophila]|uniref:Uncharacterized protein n=1 Tax=Exophiala mesophila TaxID=212818 RepID=A0A0D2AAX2_EXOME|nr:uncharacterized protein PV10_03630 [Exophiala mesophila]KIV96048.1 hypothetical protein PV10_03630 [Exophiala mesophila]